MGATVLEDTSHALYLIQDTLSKILDSLGTQGEHVDIAFGGGPNERVLQNWPTSGRKRLIVPNRARGGTLTIGAATYTDITGLNTGRGGLSIINTGANPATAFLCSAAAAQANPLGVPTGYLFASGTWDAKISNELWCGCVSVYSPLGTTLVWAEI